MNSLKNIKLYVLNSAEFKFVLVFIITFSLSCKRNRETKLTDFSSYLPIINKLSNQGNWEEAIALAEIGMNSDVSKSDRINLFVILGNNYRFFEEYEIAEQNYEKAIEHGKSASLTDNLGEAYYGLGDINYLKWSYFKEEEAIDIAKEYLDLSMKYAKKNKNLPLESKILYRQGAIYQIQGNKEESKSSFEKGLKISFSISDTIGIIRNDIHKAAELEAEGVLDSALFHYSRAYEYATAIDRNYSEAHSLCNLGLFYLDRGNLMKSQEYFIKAKYLAEELNHRIVLCRSYYGLSLVEQELGNKSEAVKYGIGGLNLAEEKGYMNYQQAFTRLLENLNNN